MGRGNRAFRAAICQRFAFRVTTRGNRPSGSAWIGRTRFAPATFADCCGLISVACHAVPGFWQITPFMAAIGFLCMTIYHWGRSDLAFDTVCGRDKKILSDPWLRFTHSALRGLIPIGLPFIAFPVEAGEFLQACGALYLVFISSLTFPHVVLVEWMDRRENEREEP